MRDWTKLWEWGTCNNLRSDWDGNKVDQFYHKPREIYDFYPTLFGKLQMILHTVFIIKVTMLFHQQNYSEHNKIFVSNLMPHAIPQWFSTAVPPLITNLWTFSQFNTSGCHNPVWISWDTKGWKNSLRHVPKKSPLSTTGTKGVQKTLVKSIEGCLVL